MSKNSKPETSIVTIRIDKDLNEHINRLKDRLGLSKADLIRNYLELSKYLIKEKNSLKSFNNRDFIVLKRSFLRKIIENLEEKTQILLGDKLARFINDISRITGNNDDINYKLDICDNLGFFQKFIDQENYVLVSKKFGPKKFVESFLYRFFWEEEMNPNYIEEKIKGNKSLNSKYSNDFTEVKRSESHYTYEFMHLAEE
jgi:hypothetical protein